MNQLIRSGILTLIAALTIATSSGLVQAKQKGGDSASAPVVTSEKVEIALLPRDISAIGTLRANQSVDIAAQINGRVSRLNIEDGVSVKQGDMI